MTQPGTRNAETQSRETWKLSKQKLGLENQNQMPTTSVNKIPDMIKTWSVISDHPDGLIANDIVLACSLKGLSSGYSVKFRYSKYALPATTP